MAYLHGPALVSAAKKMKGKRAYSSMCQAFCVITAGIGAKGDWDSDGDADAVDGWKKAKARGKVVEAKDIKHLSDVPAGTIAYWTGGSRGYGHAAITIGGGKIISTDAPTWGTIGEVTIDWIAKHWGNGLKFVGYIVNDGDGHQMVDEKQPAAPKITPRVDTYVVTTKAAPLNGRSGPGTGFEVKTSLGKGETFVSTGYTHTDGKLWIQRASDKVWFAGEYLDLVVKDKPKSIEIPVMLMPLAGYNAASAPGVKKWDANTRASLALVTKHKPTILGVTELSNKKPAKMLPLWDERSPSYDRFGGSDGRYVIGRKGYTKLIAAGVFEAPKSSLLNGDDKQCAWAVLEVEGVRVAVGVAHAENQNGKDKRTGKDADDLRVEQALSWKAQLQAQADKHGASHVLLMGDFNSRGAVRDAFAVKGWKASTPGFVVGWDRKRHEAADWMFVSDGEISTSVFNNPGSDHTALVGVWTITA